ncbi:MAG: NAD(P)/FAD-dependent oxidoreductase [Aestuariivirga sp.]|nr:NAD(P)/FAD-dependent oxidoreductase [Aestuariivirga sp.]
MASFDVIIIGAGAAGLMCAITAGARGKRVLLIDHNSQAGAKILISGGGRCNFTNTGTAPQNFLSENPHFCRSALSRYTPSDFLALMAKHSIAWHEKTLGQLFCVGSARQVVAMLLAECAASGVAVKLATKVTGIRKADGFTVETTDETHTAPALVLATGGLSIPKMGATGFSYDVAKRFGLKVITPRPALVPLKAKPEELEFYKNLSGVSLPAIASCGSTAFRESILFTHRGLSGPAILQISSHWREGQSISLDLAPGIDALRFLKERKHARPKAELKTILAELLPQRLAQAMAPTDVTRLAILLKNWTMTPDGSEGFAKAEVTAGGIDTDQLSSKTMEAKAVSGLYAIGEAVDVTGWLGGYNFQWAWASGWCAGQAV